MLLLAAAGLVARLAIVWSYFHTAGDDMQYRDLSNELFAEGRYAFARAPEPLTHSRLPGYPLFLRYLARTGGLDRDPHIRRAAHANAVLDAGTALAAGLLAVALGLSEVALWAMLLVLLSPWMIHASTFALPESLTTCLVTWQVLLCVWAWRRPSTSAAAGAWALMAGAGVLGGLAQLVRLDAISSLPALGLWLMARTSPRRRLAGVAACALGFTLAFGGWPARNLVRFGAPYFAGTEWPDAIGQPLPTGAMRWMATWSSARPGQAYFNLLLAYRNDLDLDRPGVLQPEMYSSEAERAEVVALFRRYNNEHLSPTVDRSFRALAWRRARQHPLLVFVWLPLQRCLHLWMPNSGNMLHAEWAKAPASAVEGLIVPALLIAGAVLLWRRRQRTALAVLLAPIVARTALHAFGTPVPDSRYLVEALPMMLLLGAVPVQALAVKAGIARAPEARLKDEHGARDQLAAAADRR
jgi:hypothetical protein